MSALPNSRRLRGKNLRTRRTCDAVQERLEERALFAAILWSENFDGLNYGPSVEETNRAEDVWTKVPPTGWVKEDTAVPGYNNPDLPNDVDPRPADNNGKTEWIGWTFTKKDWWSTQVDTQTRANFTRASGGIMVADPDEWDDEAHPGKEAPAWDSEAKLFNATMTTASIPLSGAVEGTYAIELDSSWRPEGFDDGARINNQTGIIEAVYNTGQTQEILHYDSDNRDGVAGPFFKPDAQNEHVVLPLNVPAGATSVKLVFKMLHAANDWWWAVDNLALTGTRNVQDVKLVGVSSGGTAANEQTLFNITYTTGANPSATATAILQLPNVPDRDAIGFNDASGLLYHASGASSTSNDPANPNYRDNHYLETVDVVAGTNALNTIYNANAQQFGRPGPFPSFVLPSTRRTDAQTGSDVRDARGPNEYESLRDFVWSEKDNVFYAVDYQGVFKISPTGTSTFVGDPFIASGGMSGVAIYNVEGQIKLLVTDAEGGNLYTMDPATGQPIGDPIVLTDTDGSFVPGVSSLVAHPSGTGLFGIANDPANPTDPTKRYLAEINPATGVVTKIGTLNAPITDLAFVYRRPSAANVAEVYVRGQSWLGDDGNAANVTFKEFMQSSGVGHTTYGYKLPAAPANTDTVSWTNADEIVVRYSGPVSGSGIPTAGQITVDGARQDYTVTQVTPIDDRTFALRLDRALGNIAGGGVDGDRIRLTIAGAGPGGGNFVQLINVLQGDASRDALGRVNAADQGYVKARLNRTSNAPGTGTQTLYTVFADVNGDGRVNAADQGAVKSRANDGMPAAAPAGDLFSATRIAEEVLA